MQQAGGAVGVGGLVKRDERWDRAAGRASGVCAAGWVALVRGMREGKVRRKRRVGRRDDIVAVYSPPRWFEVCREWVSN